MELRSCSSRHYIRAIRGGAIMRVLNVTRGRPTLSFKNLSDVYNSFKSNNNEANLERSCQDAGEETTVKAEPETSASEDASADDERSFDLDDNCFGNMTLKQIKERCKTRKRKRSQGFDSSKVKIKMEASSSLRDCGEKQVSTDDSEFMETLSSWKSKVSKNMKAKRRRRKNTASTFSQAIIPVVRCEEIQNILEFPSTGGNSAVLVEVKSEVPETDCLDNLMNDKISNDFRAYHGLENSFEMVVKEEPERAIESILQIELNHEWECHADLVPLQIVWDSSKDAVVWDSELSTDGSLNLPAIEFESDECDIHPDMQCISPQVISLIEDHHSDNHHDQPEGDTLDTLPNVATCESFHCMDKGNRGDITFCDDNSKDEFTSDAEIQAKTNSSIAFSSNNGEYLVCNSDDTQESEEKKSISFVNGDEMKHVTDAPDELASSDEYESDSELNHPRRLLSGRKAISPASQERLCKAMQSVDSHDIDYLKCKGKLAFSEQIDEKNGTAEGVTNPNKINMKPSSFKRGSQPKGILKIRQSSHTTPGFSTGCSSIQSSSTSAIAFSTRQMHDMECLVMKLTKDLKSMKDMVDDMLRSEFCLNTPLRHKVNEARLAVKNATRAEETAKRCLTVMKRNCSRFCKIMKVAEDGSHTSQDIVPKEKKKIAFADEAGERLCHVRLYEDESGALLRSD